MRRNNACALCGKLSSKWWLGLVHSGCINIIAANYQGNMLYPSSGGWYVVSVAVNVSYCSRVGFPFQNIIWGGKHPFVNCVNEGQVLQRGKKPTEVSEVDHTTTMSIQTSLGLWTTLSHLS